ncbi:MAG: S8 family peptidase [Eubacteriales bacterium]|nr:S8 family peptidase [Eubacteriales bacterium]
MDTKKLSPELNIAIGISEDEREKSLDLNVGYSQMFDEWELIIRYTGNLDSIREELPVSVIELLGGYAILRIPEYLIGSLSDYPQIDYIEKPKNLLIEQNESLASSCINRVRLPDYNLFGDGILIACLDSGVDIYHEAFRKKNGTTKIAILWDQTIPGNPPQGQTTGSVYTKDVINQAIQNKGSGISNQIVPQFDSSGHGTAVMGILEAVAPNAEFIVVKMGNPIQTGFPRTTQLMMAIDFSVRFAIQEQKPLAINISYGNNYGSHDGNSVVEQYIDTISNLYRNTIVAGTGNDGLSRRHYSGRMMQGKQEKVEINVSDYVKAFNLQLWKSYQDDFAIYVQTPTGQKIGPLSPLASVQRYSFSQEDLVIYFSEPTPYNRRQEIYFSWIPRNNDITSGIWSIVVEGNRIVNGVYDMWLPVEGSTSADVSFVVAQRQNTLVIPSTAQNVVSVSAYDSQNDTFAAFSGLGSFIYDVGNAKPDLAAPGVNVQSARVGGGYGLFTGTSFAAPFVTGASALLMQWGIVNGNDPYMFGEKVRASLIRGARRLPFQEKVPSPEVGWGALCVSDSIPL